MTTRILVVVHSAGLSNWKGKEENLLFLGTVWIHGHLKTSHLCFQSLPHTASVSYSNINGNVVNCALSNG